MSRLSRQRASHTRWSFTPRRALIVAGSVVLLLAVVVTFLVERSLESSNYLWDQYQAQGRYAYTLITDPTVVPGSAFVLGVAFSSVTSDRVVTLRSVRFPGGFPASLMLLGEGVSYTNVIGDRQWPDQRAQPVYPLNGFQLQPGKSISALIAVSPQRDGTYILGPETVHAEVAAWLGISVDIEMTYPQFAVLCVRVTQAACTAAQQEVRRRYGPPPP